MNYYLSVDGGGTKTDFLLTDRAGRPVARRRLGGCTYSYIGQAVSYTHLTLPTNSLV